MAEYLAAAPSWVAWLFATISLATALVALLYARSMALAVADRLDSARSAEQRLRRFRSLQLLGQARDLWEEAGDAEDSAEVQARVDELLQRALELDPENQKARSARHRLLQIAARIGEVDPNAEDPLRLESVDCGIEQRADEISRLVARGRFAQAYEQCRSALQRDPNHVGLTIEAGRLAAELGRFEEAEKALRRSLRLDPSHSLAHELLASLLGCQGRLAEAEELARNAVELDETSANAHNTLGVIYRKTGRVEAAAVSCRRATQLEPTHVSAHINLGVALRQLGRLAESEVAYRRAIELDPDHAVAHSSLGVALRKQNRDQEAEACYMRAIEIDPTYTPAWLNLAIALQKRGAVEEAEAAYRCALELDLSRRLPDLEERRAATAA